MSSEGVWKVTQRWETSQIKAKTTAKSVAVTAAQGPTVASLAAITKLVTSNAVAAQMKAHMRPKVRAFKTGRRPIIRWLIKR